MFTVGILSDTHMLSTNETFLSHSIQAFSHCDAILHAGDLCDSSILSAFAGKDVHAVCGNMCNRTTKLVLPPEKLIILKGYTIGLTHGTGPRHDIEKRISDMFPEVSCIVYGHTHIPACHLVGETLFINPGSFQPTGKYGAAGTYAILQIDQNGLKGSLHSLATTL